MTFSDEPRRNCDGRLVRMRKIRRSDWFIVTRVIARTRTLDLDRLFAEGGLLSFRKAVFSTSSNVQSSPDLLSHLSK